MHINVDVSDLQEIDLKTVVDGTVNGYDPETGEHFSEPKTLGDLVADKLAVYLLADMDRDARHEMVKRVSAERSRQIQARVEPLIEAAMKEPFRQTNLYGEPIGEEVTLRQLIIDQTKAMLGGGNRNNREQTILHKVVSETINLTLTKELQEAVLAEKKKLIDLLRGKAAEIITKTLEAGLTGR